MENRSYFWMLPSPIIFSTFVFAHSLCFWAERKQCGARAVLVDCHCHWSAEQSWSYPKNNILHFSVSKHLVFAGLKACHFSLLMYRKAQWGGQYWASPVLDKLDQALSGALCGPGTESKWSPFLGHISSVSSRHTCDVVHLTVVQRVKDQPFIGKVIMLKTESLFTSSGENAGEPSLATSGNVAAKISLDKMHLTFLAYTCSKSLWNVCL